MNNLQQKRLPVIGTIAAFIMLLSGLQMDAFATSDSNETAEQEIGLLRFIIRDAFSGGVNS